ncbi:MAG: DUF134 domain-containing protein [Candidatus Omnitrophota bacterium]
MSRPKKTRWISCRPHERCFRPLCKKGKKLEGVILTLDEFEAIRLCDGERRDQDAVAKKMKVHRSTVSRILASAHRKTADAFVNLKAIRIRGGCCEVSSLRKERKK